MTFPLSYICCCLFYDVHVKKEDEEEEGRGQVGVQNREFLVIYDIAGFIPPLPRGLWQIVSS